MPTTLSRPATFDDAGHAIDPIAAPVIIPGRHDVPGRVPAVCNHCRGPIAGIPARTDDGRIYHTACLIRMRTR